MNDSPDGQKLGFSEIFRQYKDPVYLYALKMLGDKDIAADIAQDTFMKLYQKQIQNEEIRDPGNWLFVVARNLCLNNIRDNKKLSNLDKIDELKEISNHTSDEKKLHLKRALLSLNPEYREAIMLKEYHGFSYSEIVEITGYTITEVRSILYRGRMELRDAYKKVNKVR